MHSALIAGIIAISIVLRWQWAPNGATWHARWNSALAAFCLPPLLLLSASVAVLAMGHHGRMAGMPVSPIGCWFGRGILALVVAAVGLALVNRLKFQVRLWQYPRVALPTGDFARCLDSAIPFAAQTGFWRSQLVVSRGWLEQLTEAEQQVILGHEQAHSYYKDPFWFFWLGIVQRCTIWLPCTQQLWQELLLLREIRADRWALQQVSPIVLAELLVRLARSTAAEPALPNVGCVGFHHGDSVEQIEQRINALLNPDDCAPIQHIRRDWGWLMLSVTPLMATWLHH